MADRQGCTARGLAGGAREQINTRGLAGGARAEESAQKAGAQERGDKRLCAIVFCADAPYGLYLAVALRSLLAHISPAHDYHIIIFDCGLKPEDWEALARMAAGQVNLRLERRDISAAMRQHAGAFTVAEGQHLSPATYGRLFIPLLCPDYAQVLYADSDMIFNCDPAAALAEDLGGALIAGAVDSNIEAERRSRAGIKKYSREALEMADDTAYINAGFLVFNADAWRRERLAEQCLRILAARSFKRHDQDMINFICKGKIHYLSPVWNYFCNLARPAQESEADLAAARIVHYVGSVKPWHCPAEPRAALWWHYARQTEAHEALSRQAEANQNGLNRETGRFTYKIFGLPLWRVQVSPKLKAYGLPGLRLAAVKTKKRGKKSYYLCGLRIFSRSPARQS